MANEVLQERRQPAPLNAFELARMELAEAAGYKCALFAFSVGNPDLPDRSEATRMDHWKLVYPAIERAERNGHIIACTSTACQTSGPDGLTDWLIYRLEHQGAAQASLQAGAVRRDRVRHRRGLIQGPSAAGWQRFTDANAYAEQLLTSGRYTERFSGRALGYAVTRWGTMRPGAAMTSTATWRGPWPTGAKRAPAQVDVNAVGRGGARGRCDNVAGRHAR
ncbi:MAG: hypothetical protein R2838_12510 [Caldilineaceae bacterium]